MRLIKLLAAVMAGAATLVLPRRRPGRLRLDRARAALRLAVRGGARYAASAPRLFAAAGERRQLLREDLALRWPAPYASSTTPRRSAPAEEIWPFAQGPAATPMGEAEAAWRARR
jgi:hypothetical protein